MIKQLAKRPKYTNVILTLVLIFAMTGGAYAAGKYVITSTKQISPKVLKALAGKQGSVGAKGVTGPTGPAGPTGAAGMAGAKGDTGLEGKEGKQGEPGKPGKSGEEGSPWTDKGTLPKGSTERGQWILAGKGIVRFTSISFQVPLAAPLSEEKTHIIGVEEGSKEPKEATAIKNGECSGTWQSPSAKSENLCLFISPGVAGEPHLAIANTEAEGPGAGISGATLGEESAEETLYLYKGSWVVTG